MRISDWSSDVCSSDLHANFEPKTSTSGAQYDVDIWKLQAGVDGSLYDGEAGRLIGGMSGHYGTISSDIASRFGDGPIRSTGYGLGGTDRKRVGTGTSVPVRVDLGGSRKIQKKRKLNATTYKYTRTH